MLRSQACLNKVGPVVLVLMSLAGCGKADAKKTVAAALADPASARFQSVESRGNHVCGEINGMDVRGAYLGYRRFVYSKDADTAVIDPQIEVAPVSANPACRKPLSYQSVEERLSCADVPRRLGEQERQRNFEQLWNQACA